jgi:hypothetical protein
MGSNNFFSKLASNDPLAQALDLPGAHKYAQYEASANQPAATGPYAGVAPSLAGANAGYVAGGPGSNPNFVQGPVTGVAPQHPAVAAANAAGAPNYAAGIQAMLKPRQQTQPTAPNVGAV